MNLAFGIVFLWLGSACIWIATHGTDAASPWEAYADVLTAVRKGID